jgi:hypothetical protein
MKPNFAAKPVTVIKAGEKHYFDTRNDASMFLFNKIDKEALDNLMRYPTANLIAYYTFHDDVIDFENKTRSSMFLL